VSATPPEHARDLASGGGLSSLRARRAPLAEPAVQRATLDAVPLSGADFDARLAGIGYAEGLRAGAVDILQLNLGKLCNMTCRHCHVDAGPDRWAETMAPETVAACLDALDQLGARTVDLTGGAPELHPGFRGLVDALVDRGVHVLDRCNLSVLLLPRNAGLADWLGERGVEVVASLPHTRKRNTDAQRGDGAFDRSIAALRLLNAAGYGRGDPGRVLTLVHNPAGAFLPGAQAPMQAEWRASLQRDHQVSFDRLIALNNMPISRFLEWLESTGNTAMYLERLLAAFNPAAVDGLMCRSTLSVGWDGQVYDCDFNQMLQLPADIPRPHIRDLTASSLLGRRVVTGRHCFGCTAGAGSSCGGATAPA
jgi:radical SAM/Cys-rich protein